jgi:hypothetical protein
MGKPKKNFENINFFPSLQNKKPFKRVIKKEELE